MLVEKDGLVCLADEQPGGEKPENLSSESCEETYVAHRRPTESSASAWFPTKSLDLDPDYGVRTLTSLCSYGFEEPRAVWRVWEEASIDKSADCPFPIRFVTGWQPAIPMGRATEDSLF